ncbi:MAG TPA: hypothetical protein VG649_11570 [Candidatus Angelobacter sp.]|nr:hypothetical protein [Candidatus Angelobacter sp.]
MGSSHLLALLMIAVAVLSILAGLLVLVRQGVQAARVRGPKENEENAEAMIQWNQLADLPKPGLSLREKTQQVLDMAFAGSATSRNGVARFVPVFNSMIADPVDGTAFQKGETVIHCACGTNYHQHSWEWIGEKNQGRCVSCKRSGMISTYMC